MLKLVLGCADTVCFEAIFAAYIYITPTTPYHEIR